MHQYGRVVRVFFEVSCAGGAICGKPLRCISSFVWAICGRWFVGVADLGFYGLAQVVWFVGASEPQGRNCSDSPVRVGKFLKWGISKKCPKKPRRLTPYRLCGDRLWARRIGQIWWCRVRNDSFSPKRSPCHPEGWRQPTGCPHGAVNPSRRCVWFADTNNEHRALG